MPDAKTTHRLVADQFGPVAANYATSAGHSDADALAALVALVDPKPSDAVLDIATGAGSVALAFAPRVARVVAFDLTPAMLDQVRTRAAERNLANVETAEGAAEALPFPDASFEVVTVRLAPHHFADIRAAVQEMARVAKPGGKVLVVDTTAPEDEMLDHEINAIEVLRDASHVRNYRPSQWRAMLAEAGLTVVEEKVDVYTDGAAVDFDDWVRRIRTPEDRVTELRHRFQSASPKLRQALRLEISGPRISFVLPQVTLLATKPAAR